ncbi:MAG: tRNA (adenosine(37)-N6)-dimethylallyltransferase MiaA [Elainellaceae cyanobacterium]
MDLTRDISGSDPLDRLQPGLIVICGPTASGKSSLALNIAQRLGCPIIGADSRQVYQELDIGTAKPSLEERRRVPHYLIDLCQPTQSFTLADYQQRTQSIVAQQHRSEKTPLLVGGTGLYIRSIVRGLKIPRVAPQPSLRSQLTHLGQPQCYAMLQQVDPQAARAIHPNDQVRTLRSLEVFYATGMPMSSQQGECPPSYPILQIGIDSAALQDRIAQRTQQMLAAGLVAEVTGLCDRYGIDLPLLKTLGYAEVVQHLRGECTLAVAQQRIVDHTRQFAKRQRTWFQSDKAIEWYDSERPDLVDAVWLRVAEFVNRCGSGPAA